MTLQTKKPDLPRPAFVAPLRKYLAPCRHRCSSRRTQKQGDHLVSVSLCSRSHSSACPCYHHSTLECLIVSHVSLCPADAPCRVCPLCSSCVSLPPSRASCRRLRLLCCLCSPVLLYWLSLPPCAPLPVLCLWFLLSALLCMYCCRCSCSDLLRVRV